MSRRTAIAIAAHPDDIEFKMGGTLLLLQRAGWDIHCFNLATGNGGSTRFDSEETSSIRSREARDAARLMGATWHPPITNDMEIFYEIHLLRKVSSVIREVRPDIVLTHPLEDYMEDHMQAARLAVSAAFTHTIANFRTDPPLPAYPGDVAVYHCMPHGACDPLRRPAVPSAWVNTAEVHHQTREALACHRSQREWLDASQGMGDYLQSMDVHAKAMGIQSGTFHMAEGWWRHQHEGFSRSDSDPLAAALGADYLLNPGFEATTSRRQSRRRTSA